MWNLVHCIYRGMDVKNSPPSCKVTIQAPSYFNLRRDGVDDAVVSLAPLFFRKAIL